MIRINEEEAANKFIADATDGFYRYDRSQNTEVNYSEEKEQRDTEAVKNAVNSSLFSMVRDLRWFIVWLLVKTETIFLNIW